MKYSKLFINLSLAALIAITSVALSRTVSAQQGQPITKKESIVWEYKLIIPNETGPDLHERRRANLEAQLNEAGQDGWEAVDTPYLKGVRYQVVIMKRPLQR